MYFSKGRKQLTPTDHSSALKVGRKEEKGSGNIQSYGICLSQVTSTYDEAFLSLK